MAQQVHVATLEQGPIEYTERGGTERGDGPVVVAVHGYAMGRELWDEFAELLADDGLRVITPTWPMGAHRLPMRDSRDCDPQGQADIVASFLEALELDDVMLVGNDSGGAVCQIVATRHPERISHLVLTNCDALDSFPPLLFKPLVLAARSPRLFRWIVRALRSSTLRRSPLAYGLLSHRGVDALARDWVAAMDEPRVLEDTRRYTLGMRPEVTEAVARDLPSLSMPAVVVWGRDDRLFPVSLGRRLADAMRATFVEVADSRTLVMIDRPERLAEVITGFAGNSTAFGGNSTAFAGNGTAFAGDTTARSARFSR